MPAETPLTAASPAEQKIVMQSCKSHQPPDLIQVEVVTAPLLTGVEQCAIRFHGREMANLLLLPEGMFSLLAHRMSDLAIDAVALALGRVIAEHVEKDGSLCDPEAVRPRTAPAMVGRPSGPPLFWPSIPGVTVAMPAVRDDRFFQCELRAGDETALLLIERDPVMARGWAQFSARIPSRQLLTMLGRLVITGPGIPSRR